MKNIYSFRFWLLLLLSTAASLAAKATHSMGGQITYTNISGPNYKVDVVVYVDPTSPASNVTNLRLVCKRNGCLYPSTGSFYVDVYQISRTPLHATCFGPQLVAVEFSANVNLPPAQWLLSVDDELRSSYFSNLIAANTKSLHLEAFLDNTLLQSDSSPQFTTSLPLRARVSAPHLYSFAAFDADGDSLVYRSVQPQFSIVQPNTYSCPDPVPYQSYSGGSFPDPATGQTITYPGGQFSAALPLPSFSVNQGSAVPYAALDATNGNFRTMPVLLGTYAVAVRIDSYRRINGSMVKIGSVMREVPYVVFNPGTPNTNPTLAVALGGTAVPIDQPIAVQPGQNLTLTFTGSDPDAGQIVRVSSNVAAVIPGATFQPNLVTPTAQFTWQIPPTTTHGTYTFSVAVQDNACPLNGTEVRAVTLRVGARPTASGAPRQLVQLPAYPTPFTSQVRFQLPKPAPQAILVTDALGRTVAELRSQADGSVQWQPAALAPGIYFARPASGAQVFRLVKAE